MREPMAVVERDDGLAHLRRATRWVVAGTLWLAGLLALVVSQALPGRPATASTPSTPSTPSAGSFTSPPTSPATTTPNLQAPAQAPTPTTAPAPVLSGGS